MASKVQQQQLRDFGQSSDQGLRLTATLAELAFRHGLQLAESQMAAARQTATALPDVLPKFTAPSLFDIWSSYLTDVGQRSVLFLDTLCRRGNATLDRAKEGFKPVLAFDYDVVVDGRHLRRPVNYSLVRIHPPEGLSAPSEDSRPWVIIDPRAGHGSGIGGFKGESEVGVALKNGHPVYFVIFYPDPEPGQTLADVCAAEAAFLREIQNRHPRSPKPLVTGNCQGGWASMILAATHPDLMGPIVIAGAPLSYWSGEKGRNAFRYFGGIFGGAFPALLLSDLGGGIFDGADLVQNFEQLNPGKTLWRKNFDLFAGIDRDAERFLEFERWWSGFYFMNRDEICWIVENLFIGNRLVRGEAMLDDGTPVDLTRIQAPVVVFASHGDNITPPQQALNWIADLYGSVADIRASGRVIIYTLHDSIGHLGIFVSAEVANTQHEQIGSVVKTIETLAPGLYEMQIVRDERDQITVAFEARTIDDLLKFDDGRDEEVAFAAAAKLSEWMVKTYEVTLQPLLRSIANPEFSMARKQLHPQRQQQQFFSRRNPMFTNIAEAADHVREARRPAALDNPFIELERIGADMIERGWNLYRDSRDAAIELTFHGLYATPWMLRLGANPARRPRAHGNQAAPFSHEAIAKAKSGGYAEGIIRMLILLARARGSVRRERLERSDRILHARAPFRSMTLEQRSRMIHEQSMIVDYAGEEAVTSLADILVDPVDRYRALNMVLEISGPVDEMDPATIAMFRRFQRVLLTLAHDWREPGEAAVIPAESGSISSDAADNVTVAEMLRRA